jgi:hypothetical protein
MALFKILKGPESGLPATKHEGWAYVTNEGNFYVDISDTVRVKINGNADEATKATYDSADQKITDTYIKDIILNDSATKPYYTFMLGNGTLRDADGDGTTDQLLIPVASSSKAGVVTTGTQTLKGKKTFSSLITASAGLTSKADITTTKQFVSTLADGTAPFSITSTTMSPNLNADMVDGMHASNLPFNNENSSETTVPTQRAIWSSLNDLLVAAHALVYRGTIDPNKASTHPNAPSVGDVYIISAEGTFAGVYCEPGDMAIYYASGWDIVQVNINGAVTIKTGGAYNSLHATVNAIPRFDETSGRVIKNSKVTIDDNGHVVPVDNGAQNLGSTGNLWGTIYGNSFTGTANQATHDDSGQVIKNTYIKDIVYVQDDSTKSGSKSSPYLRYLFGHGTNPVYLAMPVAGAQQGGIITAGAQNISGVKTLNATDGGLIIPKADSFQYSGIKADTAASTTKYIWFSTTGGIPKYNTGLAFNPACSDAWASYDGTKVTAYKVITTDRFKGLSLKALQDDQGQVIKNVYLQDVILNTSASAPYYTLKLGNGTLKDTDGTSGADKVIIPVASASQAGVITADKSKTQTLTGPKKIDTNGSLEIAGSNAFKYTGIQNGTSNDTHYLWFADKDAVGVPLKNTSLSFNPAASIKWSHDTANVTAAVLTVARLNGIALQALQDSQGQVIDDLYLQDVILNNSASAPYYTLKLGNGTLKDTDGTSGADQVIIPVASATQAGIITADKSNAQTITGDKIIDANGSLEIKKAGGFNYSAIQTGTSAGARPIWFSHISLSGVPCIAETFTFNPAASVTWSHDSTAQTVGLLKIDRVDGISLKALQDSQGLVIDDTYIKNVVLTNHATAPYYTLTLGNGLSKTNSDGTNQKVLLPVAGKDYAGVVTNSTQGIYGQKTFYGGVVFDNTSFNYSKIEQGTTDAARCVWFADSSLVGKPVYSTKFTYNPATDTLKAANFTGLSAKATADASGQTITSTYLKDITYSNYQFTIKLGSGTTLRTIAPLFAASDTCGGDAKKAKTWSNNLKLELIGEVTGSATFDGDEGTVQITTSLANSNVTALDGRYIRKDKADSTSYTLTLNNTTDLNATLTTAQGALIVKGGVHVAKQLYASKVHNAVWNDYAECRKAETIEPGRVVVEHESGEMKVSSERLQAGGSIISDTYGSCMGETAECKTPIAVAGRVLAYTYEDRNTYPLGAAVCAAPNGTVSVMTREEIREYPERILGTVSEIPDYEVWGTGNIQVNNRIWIKVR